MAKATIDDVAELAGVSIKTVSRVVNHEPNVRDSTREKVASAIAALQYQPNQSARGLASSRSFLLGLIYSNPSSSYIMNAQLGALESCRKEGYNLLIHPCDYNSDKLALEVAELVRSSRLDGLVLTPPVTDNIALIGELDRQAIPYTSIAPIKRAGNASSVVCDDRLAAAEITQHLISLGHQRIAFILGHQDHGATHERYKGYCDALKDHGLALSANWVKNGDFEFETARECALELLQQQSAPTAIFASNDYMAGAVLVAAQQLGVKVPEQLSVAGFDDVPLATQTWPALTTIRQPVHAMAAKATQLLIERIKNPTAPAEQVLLHCELIKRESTVAPA